MRLKTWSGSIVSSKHSPWKNKYTEKQLIKNVLLGWKRAGKPKTLNQIIVKELTMPAKKKKPRKMNFLKRLHARPKIKAVKRKIAKSDSARKKLSREYKRLIKSESKILKKKK